MSSWSGDGRRAASIGRLVRGLTADNPGELVEEGVWKGHKGNQSRPYWVWRSVFRDRTHIWVFLDRDPRKKPQRSVHEQSVKWLAKQKAKGNVCKVQTVSSPNPQVKSSTALDMSV